MEVLCILNAISHAGKSLVASHQAVVISVLETGSMEAQNLSAPHLQVTENMGRKLMDG